MPPRPAAIMIQGTGSNVGKSLVVAGLCRLMANHGLRVRPFKPQNMSNNAAATPDGGEIGRAQALQARAARIPANVHMNPVLLKPESDSGSQVIVQGNRWQTLKARDYTAKKRQLLPAVLDSFSRISSDADLVIVEGAGSPAEINLRAGDIANMGFAEAAELPVALVGDIDRGGVIASLVGCHAVLEEHERTRIKAFIINRFRGDVTLFDDGMTAISKRTGWRGLGIVPYFDRAHCLPAEDSSDLDRPQDRAARQPPSSSRLHIAVPRLPRIANFDDLDPLRQEPGIKLTMLNPGEAVPGDTDLVILTGSKATIADLAALRRNGWDIDIKAHVRRGGSVIGLCGGYQMLGRQIHDPDGLEGPPGAVEGLGLLDVATTLQPHKSVRQVTANDPVSGADLTGYEIHLGETCGPDTQRPFLTVDGHSQGAISQDGRIIGTYVHGLFAADAFRKHFLDRLRPGTGSDLAFETGVDAALDALANHLEQHLDIEALMSIARAR